jgi:hypothetical protein
LDPLDRYRLSGPVLRSLMRKHKVTVRHLARTLGTALKCVRSARAAGLSGPYTCLDYCEAITGRKVTLPAYHRTDCPWVVWDAVQSLLTAEPLPRI